MADLEHAALQWRWSTASGGGNCVEVATRAGAVLIRDSKDPSGAVLSFSPSEWAKFLAGIRAGLRS